MSARRKQVLDRVVTLLPERPEGGWVLVGIDGGDGAGKTTFADDLASVLRSSGSPVVRVSVDDFHHPRQIRYRRGRTSPSGFWLDSFDYARLGEYVLQPLGPGGTGRYRPRSHDVNTDELLEEREQVAEPGGVVIIDGLFLHREELRGAWDFTVFLDVPYEVTAARMAIRDGTHPDPSHPSMRRYVEAQDRSTRRCVSDALHRRRSAPTTPRHISGLARARCRHSKVESSSPRTSTCS